MGTPKAAVAPAPDEIAMLELYKLARAQIEHENTLVGQRITWYLTLQGLLFTALFVAIGLLIDTSKFPIGSIARQSLAVATVLLQCVGVLSSVACFLLIRAAYAQIDRVVAWWGKQKRNEHTFPVITGTGGFKLFSYHVTGADFVLVILAVWVCFLCVFWYSR